MQTRKQDHRTQDPARRTLRARFSAVTGAFARARREKRLLRMAFGFAAFTVRELARPREFALFVGSVLAPFPGPNVAWLLYHFNKYARRIEAANDNAAQKAVSKARPGRCSRPRPRG